MIKSRCGTLSEPGNVIPGKHIEISQLFVKLVFCEQLSRANKANAHNDNSKMQNRITKCDKHKTRPSRLSRSRNTMKHYIRRSEYQTEEESPPLSFPSVIDIRFATEYHPITTDFMGTLKTAPARF